MANSSPIDLAQAEHWLGVRPGMTQAQVQAAMIQQGVTLEDYGDGNFVASAEDWEMDFFFTSDGSERLRQLSIDGTLAQWSGKPITDVPLDEALRAMDPIGAAAWQANDVLDMPFPEPTPEPPAPVSDADLLSEGTLWLTGRSLALVVYGGSVVAVAWRAPQDLPTRFAGPLTEAQRQLSLRKDVDDYLIEQRMEQHKIVVVPDPMRWPKRLVTLATIGALAWLGRLGFEETRLWSQAPVIQAKLISVEKVTMKQFRDYVPPALRWIIPTPRAVQVEAYRVGFDDPSGQHHEAVLERGELYVPPEKVGDEVPVVMVAGDPPRIVGASRARDYAFIQYVPVGIVIGAVYLIAILALGMIPPILRMLAPRLRKMVPSATIKDPDRPELR